MKKKAKKNFKKVNKKELKKVKGGYCLDNPLGQSLCLPDDLTAEEPNKK